MLAEGVFLERVRSLIAEQGGPGAARSDRQSEPAFIRKDVGRRQGALAVQKTHFDPGSTRPGTDLLFGACLCNSAQKIDVSGT